MGKLKRVSTDEFADAIMDILDEYGGYVGDTVVQRAVHKTAEETAEAIAAAAPRRTGRYSESITSGKPNQRGKKYTETVYADAPYYRLTHLLERPHATRSGGRTTPKPHWVSGMNSVAGRFVKNLKEALK